MKQNTKQRIVGSVVLLALALIFLPLVFDGQGSYQQPMTSRIPELPVVETLPQPIQARPDIRDDTNLSDDNDLVLIEPDTTAEFTDFSPASDTPATSDPVDEPNIVPVVESEPDVAAIPPGLDANGLPQGWSVRLGSFKVADNANGLLERLRTAGYKAYSRNINTTQGQLTGVFVGPWVERTTVEDYRRQLQQDFQLSGIVVRFEVDQL